MKYLKLLIIGISSLFIVYGCGGGGGGGSSTTPTATNFSLFADDEFIAGTQKSFSLTGSDNTGQKYTETISMQTGNSTTFNGVQAIPLQQIIVLTDTTTNQFITISQTGYYSDSTSRRQLLGIVSDTYNVTYLATTDNILPQDVNIGDLGTIGTYVADDGTSYSQTWQITDAGNGRANRIIATTTKDKNGTITGSAEVTEVMDKDHNILSITYRMYSANTGATATLTGD
jgi:hypothetical protein